MLKPVDTVPLPLPQKCAKAHRHHAGDDVEGTVLVGELRVHIQILHVVRLQLLVFAQLILIHPQPSKA